MMPFGSSGRVRRMRRMVEWIRGCGGVRTVGRHASGHSTRHHRVIIVHGGHRLISHERSPAGGVVRAGCMYGTEGRKGQQPIENA